MEKNIEAITPREIISSISTATSKTEGGQCEDNPKNKAKIILKSYDLLDKFKGSIIEQYPLYGMTQTDSIRFSKDGDNNRIQSQFKHISGHLLPVMNIEVSEFISLMNKYENFDIFHNKYGIPSIIFGQYQDKKPIIMPIVNWDNLPETINPYGEKTNRNKKFATHVQIAPPPQFFNQMQYNEKDDSYFFSPETSLQMEDEVKPLLDHMFKNCAFFDTPIELTTRQNELTSTARLIQAVKLNQESKKYEYLNKKYMGLISELFESNAELARKLHIETHKTARIAEKIRRKELYEDEIASEKAKQKSFEEFYRNHFGENAFDPDVIFREPIEFEEEMNK